MESCTSFSCVCLDCPSRARKYLQRNFNSIANIEINSTNTATGTSEKITTMNISVFEPLSFFVDCFSKAVGVTETKKKRHYMR